MEDLAHQALDLQLSARIHLLGGVVLHARKLVLLIQEDMQVRLLGVLHEIVRDGAEVHVHVQHVTSGTALLFARIARGMKETLDNSLAQALPHSLHHGHQQACLLVLPCVTALFVNIKVLGSCLPGIVQLQVSVTPQCVVQEVAQLQQDAHATAHVCALGNSQEYLHSEEDAEQLHQCFLVALQQKVLVLLDTQRLQHAPID